MTETPMDEAAVQINEMIQSFVRGGFSREEAIRFAAIWLAESGRKPEHGDDGA